MWVMGLLFLFLDLNIMICGPYALRLTYVVIFNVLSLLLLDKTRTNLKFTCTIISLAE